MSIEQAKTELRQQMRQLLRDQRGQLADFSAGVSRNLSGWAGFRRARTVLAYAPLASEPDLQGALQAAAAAGVILLYPRVEVEGMTARRADSGSWVTSRHGTCEPDEGAPIFSPAEIDLVLVPGLAFDPVNGARLGRGAGYFDRFLIGLPAACFKLGVCFGFQLVAGLPQESHDVAMDGILTENGMLTDWGRSRHAPENPP